MNNLQREAFIEGVSMIVQGFNGNHKISPVTLKSWVVGFCNGQTTIEKNQIKHKRDKNGDIQESTTLKITHAEYCDFRLMGAFHAIEGVARAVNKTGMKLSDASINFPNSAAD